MNEKLFMFIHCVKFIKEYMIRPSGLCTSKYSQKDILGSWLIAYCKLTPTLARQM